MEQCFVENRRNESVQRIDAMFKYIEQCFAIEQEATIDDVAAILCESKQSTERIFRFLTGYTFNEYLKRRKLSLAALELLRQDTKVLDIAVKYGYGSSQAFARAFKECLGLKPSDVFKPNQSLKLFVPYLWVQALQTKELTFELVQLEPFTLYAKQIFAGDSQQIGNAARQFWHSCDLTQWQGARYGFTVLPAGEEPDGSYHVASDRPFVGATPFMCKASNWAIFHFNPNDRVKFNIASILAFWREESGLKRDPSLPILEKYLADEMQVLFPITFAKI